MTGEFWVGEWRVRPDLNSISRDDKAVQIEPKVIDVLVCLAEHPGEVLSKEELARMVWPDTHVGDEVLRYSISALRKAFADDVKNPHIIQTIPRRGYRLVAPVSRQASGLASQPSIAVMAFSDMSPQGDQGYFCDGIAEEIINILTHVKGLRVVARTSSFAFKGRSADVRAIGRSLGVAMVLEGSVRKAGDQLRISAQLIHVGEDRHLWSETYERDTKDVFAIQDEIARSIASTLRITLSPEQSDAIARAPTSDLRAYDYYLRGRQFFYQYKREGMEFALQMFSNAIAIDPTYVRAYAGIADCSSFLFMYAGSHDIHRQQADSASRKAVDLDPESAEANASRAVALSIKGEYAAAERAFEKAILLDPYLFEAYYFYARFSFVQGKLEKAAELYQKASEVNPQDYQALLLVAQIYIDLGRLKEAEATRRRGIQVAEARLLLNPDDARALYMGANGLVALGEFERGLVWAQKALALDPDEPMVLYNVACIQSLAGRVEEAMDSLERAVLSGLTQKEWIVHDSNLDAVRPHPRYQGLLDLLEKGDSAV